MRRRSGTRSFRSGARRPAVSYGGLGGRRGTRRPRRAGGRPGERAAPVAGGMIPQGTGPSGGARAGGPGGWVGRVAGATTRATLARGDPCQPRREGRRGSARESGDAAEEVARRRALARRERGQRRQAAGGEGAALLGVHVRLHDQDRRHAGGRELAEVRCEVGQASVEEPRSTGVDGGREAVALGVLQQEVDLPARAGRLVEALRPAQLVPCAQDLLAAEGERLDRRRRVEAPEIGRQARDLVEGCLGRDDDADRGPPPCITGLDGEPADGRRGTRAQTLQRVLEDRARRLRQGPQ